MGINLATETTFPLPQASKYLPNGRRGRPVHFTTLLRWVLDGVVGPAGQRIRLEAIRLGSKWVTSKEALQRFAEALTPAVDEPLPTPRTPISRQKASERAAKELERMGV
jgi:hypothetical protein